MSHALDSQVVINDTTHWGFQTGWIAVGLISLVLIAPLGTALIEPRRRAIERLAQEAPDGPLPESLERRIHDPILLTALQTVATLLLGIVFLMTTKPALTGSLIVIAIALALGLASGALASRTMRTPGQSAFTGRYFIMTLRKLLRPRRSGGGGCGGWGRLHRPRPAAPSHHSCHPR